jgi:hypothetical protein
MSPRQRRDDARQDRLTRRCCQAVLQEEDTAGGRTLIPKSASGWIFASLFCPPYLLTFKPANLPTFFPFTLSCEGSFEGPLATQITTSETIDITWTSEIVPFVPRFLSPDFPVPRFPQDSLLR